MQTPFTERRKLKTGAQMFFTWLNCVSNKSGWSRASEAGWTHYVDSLLAWEIKSLAGCKESICKRVYSFETQSFQLSSLSKLLSDTTQPSIIFSIKLTWSLQVFWKKKNRQDFGVCMMLHLQFSKSNQKPNYSLQFNSESLFNQCSDV